MKFYYVYFVALTLIISSCDRSKHDEELRNEETLSTRAKEINSKEQQLQLWEQRLQSKEKELTAREQALDSTTRQLDSTGRQLDSASKQLDSNSRRLEAAGIHDSTLVGNWLVNMQCTSTTCEGSAIGDTKSEQWKISYQNNQVVVEVISNKKLNRIYTGLYAKNSLQLTARQQQENAETNITINLHPTTKNKMEGEREINQAGNCKIVYAVAIKKL